MEELESTDLLCRSAYQIWNAKKKMNEVKTINICDGGCDCKDGSWITPMLVRLRF